MSARGYFSIGIWHPKTEINVGSLWRTAHLLGAAFVFTVGRRYRKQASDTMKTPRHVPLFHFEDLSDMRGHLPHGCRLVCVELDARSTPLSAFNHPQQVAYLLGAEDHGLPPVVLDTAHAIVQLPGEHSMNVAVAGSIVIYDRVTKRPA